MACAVLRASQGFNPRAREGATVYLAHFWARVGVSTHAPVKARRRAGGWHENKRWFQPTRP